jgi:hypothetical protein
VPESRPQTLTVDDLHAELARFRHELRAGGLKEGTVHSYVSGSSFFVRWLAGEYMPGRARERRGRSKEPL